MALLPIQSFNLFKLLFFGIVRCLVISFLHSNVLLLSCHHLKNLEFYFQAQFKLRFDHFILYAGRRRILLYCIRVCYLIQFVLQDKNNEDLLPDFVVCHIFIQFQFVLIQMNLRLIHFDGLADFIHLKYLLLAHKCQSHEINLFIASDHHE